MLEHQVCYTDGSPFCAYVPTFYRRQIILLRSLEFRCCNLLKIIEFYHPSDQFGWYHFIHHWNLSSCDFVCVVSWCFLAVFFFFWHTFCVFLFAKRFSHLHWVCSPPIFFFFSEEVPLTSTMMIDVIKQPFQLLEYFSADVWQLLMYYPEPSTTHLNLTPWFAFLSDKDSTLYLLFLFVFCNLLILFNSIDVSLPTEDCEVHQSLYIGYFFGTAVIQWASEFGHVLLN
jgi:hypothetical protein